MKRPIQLLFLLPFLIALLLAPASDLQSKPTPGQVGQSPSSSADLSAAFEGVGQKAVDLSAKAQSLQEQGDFQGAIIELERALRLDRGNRQLQKDLANAQQKLNERGEILRNLPADPKEREAELAKRYETATAAEAAGQRDKAREGYYEIWLANGTYRDVSAKLKSIDATPAVSAAPVAIASVAPEAPKPAAPAKPIDLKPLADSKLKPAEAVAAAPVAEIKAPEIKSRDLTGL